jgi:hypothetical protein
MSGKAGIGCLAAWAAVLAAAGCVPATVVTPHTPTPSPVITLAVGDCLGEIDFETATLAMVEPVACDQSHYYEVHALVPLEQQAYPGQAALAQQAADDCSASFTEYVGVAAEYSRYSSAYLAPDDVTWSVPADRKIVCLAGSSDGGLKGSLKGDTTIFPAKGQCTGPQDVPPLEVKIVSCKKKHNYEVYATAKVSGKNPPTGDALAKLVDKTCKAKFTDFIGVAPAQSKYEYVWFLADKDSWKNLKDHRLVCSVGLAKGGVKGSLKGVKQ